MNEDLVVALIERIKNEEDREALRKEVLVAGYDLHEFKAAYEEAARRLGVAAHVPVPPPPQQSPESAPPVPSNLPVEPTSAPTSAPAADPAPVATESAVEGEPMVASQDPIVATPEVTLSTPHKGSNHLLLFVGVGGFVVLLGLALALAFTVKSGPLSFFSGMFSSAPYAEDSFLEDLALGVSKIESAGYKFSFSAESVELDSDTYLLPEELNLEEGEDLAAMLAFIPEDLDISGSLTGKVSLDDSEVPDFYSRLEGSYNTDDFSMHADAEVMVLKEEGVFVKINRMPSLFFLDFSSLKGEWLHVFAEALDIEDVADIQEKVMADPEREEQLKLLLELVQKHQILALDGSSVEEEINGDIAYKYTVMLNQPALSAFFEEAQSEFERKYGEDNILNEMDEEFGLQRFVTSAYVEYFNTHHKFVLWGRSDGVPVRYGVESRIPIDNDVDPFGGFSEEDIEDITSKQILIGLRAEAEFYFYDNTSSYKGFCLDRDVLMTLGSVEGYKCTDEESAYVIDMTMSDGKKYCVDSTGFAEELHYASGTKCVDQENFVAQPEETEPREAERQLNVSFYVDLLNVNDSVKIEAPAESLDIEEIKARNPMIGEMLDSLGHLEEARAKGDDAAAKQLLSAMRAEAELSYGDSGSSYKNVCDYTDSLWNDKDFTGECLDSDGAYIAEMELSDGTFFCIDSTGLAIETPQPSVSEGNFLCGR